MPVVMTITRPSSYNNNNLRANAYKNRAKPRAHHLEPSTALCFCHGVFADKSIFSFNLPRTIRTHESTSTNQD